MGHGSDHERLLGGLRHLNAVARELLAQGSLEEVLARIVEAARQLAGADFAALLLLRPGTTDEVAQFVYDAPRELFPDHLPRVVGLLAVPIERRWAARIADIRGHPAGVGIPVEHPPIAALLAVPIILEDRVVGEVAVANGVDGDAFDDVDEVLVTELAGHAATAVSLATARRAQARLDETRRALLDVALHNLRTPLTVATGFLSVLRKHGERLGEQGREDAFDAIARAHARIQELAEGALLADPARPSGQVGEPEEVDVAALLHEVVTGAAGPDGGVVVESGVLPGVPPHFLADRRMVRELLDNLVSNAVKHSPPGQVVRVTARREGSSVRFDVTDRGPGIAPEDQARIFEQHYRTRQSQDEAVPGSGLGLWIARRLADLLGGTLGVTSRVGQGTTFWATFPVAGLPEADG